MDDAYGGGWDNPYSGGTWWDTPPSSIDQPVSFDWNLGGAWDNPVAPVAPSTGLDWNEPPSGNPTQQMVNWFTGQAGGNVDQALLDATTQRWHYPGGATNPYTANAEHQLFSQSMANQGILGKALVAGGVPIYNAAKAGLQNIPGAERITRAVTPQSWQKWIPYSDTSSPASWEQFWSGLRPLLPNLPFPTGGALVR